MMMGISVEKFNELTAAMKRLTDAASKSLPEPYYLRYKRHADRRRR